MSGAQGAATGAKIGSSFGPIGTGIGAVAGAVLGALTGGKKDGYAQPVGWTVSGTATKAGLSGSVTGFSQNSSTRYAIDTTNTGETESINNTIRALWSQFGLPDDAAVPLQFDVPYAAGFSKPSRELTASAFANAAGIQPMTDTTMQAPQITGATPPGTPTGPAATSPTAPASAPVAAADALAGVSPLALLAIAAVLYWAFKG